MSEVMEKYVAKALEGYEQNYKAISEAITQMELQLEKYREQRDEMQTGIVEMKGLLGLAEETEDHPKELSESDLKLVKDFEE